MKPPSFSYAAPTSLDETIALLGTHGGDAKLLAGGQSLMPLLNMRLARPHVLIDLNRVAELAYIEENGALKLGALVRHAELERSSFLARACPLLVEAVPYIGHLAIRNRGTLGGSVAHADPAAELPGVLVALDAQIHVAGPAGERTVPASDFFVTYLTTDLGEDELVTAVTLPPWPSRAGWAFLEFARRHGDYALVGVAAVVTPAAGGETCAEARISLIGVGGTPVRAREAEARLAGAALGEQIIAEAAAAAAAELEPEGDLHASADYRRALARTLVARALTQAWSKRES